MTPQPPNPPPNIPPTWGLVFNFLNFKAMCVAKKITVICGLIMAIFGVVYATNNALNSWRKSADEAEKARHEMAVAEVRRVDAEKIKAQHDKDIEEIVLKTQGTMQMNSVKIIELSTNQKNLAATVDAIRADISALVVKQGMTPKPVVVP